MAKRALGKGIGALIGETDDARHQAAAKSPIRLPSWTAAQ